MISSGRASWFAISGEKKIPVNPHISLGNIPNLIKLKFKEIFIVPEGLNAKPLNKSPGKEKEPTLIFVGRLKKSKCPDHAIEAFKIVKKEILDAKLWIVGDGYMKNELEKMSDLNEGSEINLGIAPLVVVGHGRALAADQLGRRAPVGPYRNGWSAPQDVAYRLSRLGLWSLRGRPSPEP